MVSNLGLNKLEQEQVQLAADLGGGQGDNVDEPHNSFLRTQSVRKTRQVLVLVKGMHKCTYILSICIKFRPIWVTFK